MDDRDICITADRSGAVNFIAWDRGEAAKLIGATLAGNPKVDHRGASSAADILGGGYPWMAFIDGLPVVLVVLDVVPWSGGRDLEIRAAVALSGRSDATENVLPEIERVFGRDCNSVTIYTKRAGLVRKLARAGYHEAATIMRKSK
jgi:hypothetical protein